MTVKDMLLAGRTSEFKDGDKKMAPHGKGEIAVYFIKDNWYAYQNFCPHQGGPACEGLTMAKVEAILDVDKTFHGMRFNHDKMQIVCPWHGWEFRMEDGVSAADSQHRLRKYEVEIKGDEVYILT